MFTRWDPKLKETETGVDPQVASDLVRASELYRVGEYDLAIILIDRAVELAIVQLLRKHGIRRESIERRHGANLRDLLESAVEAKVITNETLVKDIQSMHVVRNRLLHGLGKADAVSVSKYLDLAYLLVGTVPYTEGLSKIFMEYGRKRVLQEWRTFEQSVYEILKREPGIKVEVEPIIGRPGKFLRPDAVITDKDGNVTLIEVKSSLTNSLALRQLEGQKEAAKEAGLRVKEVWLVLPERNLENSRRILKMMPKREFSVKTVKDGKLVEVKNG